MPKTVIIEGTVSYPHLDAPRKIGEGEGKAKYGLTLVVPKEVQQTEAWKALYEAAVEVAVDKWGPKKGPAMVTIGGKHSTFRNDGAEKGYPEGALYFGARSDSPPGLVYPWPESPGSKRPAVVPPEKVRETFYPGSYVRISVRPFAYENSGNRGVGFGLQNVQWLKHGERLDGRRSPQEEFEADLTRAPEILEDDPIFQ